MRSTDTLWYVRVHTGKSLEWVKSKILGKPGTTVLLTMLREGHPYTMVVVREGSRPAGESKMAYGYVHQRVRLSCSQHVCCILMG